MPRTKKTPDAPPAGAEPEVADETPFVDDYLPALLSQASQLISGEFHRIVTAKGWTVSEWRVLASLAGGRTMSIGELAAVATMKQPTVTRVLDRMQARGDVKRVAHDHDRRITMVRITAKGKRSVDRLIPLAREHADRVLEPFGRERAAELTAVLKAMIVQHGGARAIDPDDDGT